MLFKKYKLMIFFRDTTAMCHHFNALNNIRALKKAEKTISEILLRLANPSFINNATLSKEETTSIFIKKWNFHSYRDLTI